MNLKESQTRKLVLLIGFIEGIGGQGTFCLPFFIYFHASMFTHKFSQPYANPFFKLCNAQDKVFIGKILYLLMGKLEIHCKLDF